MASGWLHLLHSIANAVKARDHPLNPLLLPCLPQGEWLRSYQPMGERTQKVQPGADELGPVPPSNAYVRRISGSQF